MNGFLNSTIPFGRDLVGFIFLRSFRSDSRVKVVFLLDFNWMAYFNLIKINKS